MGAFRPPFYNDRLFLNYEASCDSSARVTRSMNTIPPKRSSSIGSPVDTRETSAFSRSGKDDVERPPDETARDHCGMERSGGKLAGLPG